MELYDRYIQDVVGDPDELSILFIKLYVEIGDILDDSDEDTLDDSSNKSPLLNKNNEESINIIFLYIKYKNIF